MEQSLRESLREEVKSLRGMEMTCYFGAKNGVELDGKEAYAYVAQADIDKGITIMGKLPDGVSEAAYGSKDGGDIIFHCCNCHGDPDHGLYLVYIQEYIELIKSGEFNMSNESNERSGTGNSSHMNASCAFI